MPRRSSLAIIAVASALLALSCARAPSGPESNTWRFLPGRVEPFSTPAFRNGRQCWVYLPPGYATSGRRYPVLYANDGASVFDGQAHLHLNRIAEDLIRRGEMEPIIIVAIDQISGEQRFVDYAPWPAYITPSGFADFYLLAVRDSLKPEIDRRYRTLGDPANTAMMGMSLSGLLSVYAGFVYDSTFGKVAGLSPSYQIAGYRILDVARLRGRPAILRRFYQDAGTVNDVSIGGMNALALQLGFVPGVDFLSITVNGAGHTSGAWEQRSAGMLRFLFPPR